MRKYITFTKQNINIGLIDPFLKNNSKAKIIKFL